MVFFRVDSNDTIAGGHIMRCLTIAKALIKSGTDVHFLVADNNPCLVLDAAGISYTVLGTDWRNLMSDAEQVRRILQAEVRPVLFIDTYSVTEEYVSFFKPVCKIVYLGSKCEKLGPLDLLINYSTDINYEFYKSNYSANTRLLLGPLYAPLREEFQNHKKYYGDAVGRILLTTGNTDCNQIVYSLLKALIPLVEDYDIVVDVVVGRMFNNKDILHNTYGNNPNICLYENIQSMATLMEKCDLAISANGTTVYELVAMGIPTITFAMVAEQTNSAEKLSSLGVIEYCGTSYDEKEACIGKIKCEIDYYINHNDALIALASKARSLIDGNGCQRIVKAINGLN